MRSGSEDVRAATIAPEGAYMRAFSVTRERSTVARHGPTYVQRAVQPSQKATHSLSASAANAPISAGVVAASVNTKSIVSPWESRKVIALSA